MTSYEQREEAWKKMTEDERLLAYAKAKLANAKFTDRVRRHKSSWSSTPEQNNLWYDMMTTFIYTSREKQDE